MNELHPILCEYDPALVDAHLEPLGTGLINSTYWVRPKNSTHTFVLQRVNSAVFPDPQKIIENHLQLENYLAKQPCNNARPLQIPALVKTRTGASHLWDAQGALWRMSPFIHGTCTFESIDGNKIRAAEAGTMLARFHSAFAQMDPNTLHDTLPGFHSAPEYWRQFQKVRDTSPVALHSEEVQRAIQFIEERHDLISVLEDAKQLGLLPLRVTHGDPKLNNILFAESGEQAQALIDLDTVKPGLIHYDLGDCLRSCCNTAGENATPQSSVEFDLGVAEILLAAYLHKARDFLNPPEWDYFYPAIRLLPLELALRFLTDHLAGDRYFRIDTPGQNLRRAQVQLALVKSIEAQELGICAVIASMR